MGNDTLRAGATTRAGEAEKQARKEKDAGWKVRCALRKRRDDTGKGRAERQGVTEMESAASHPAEQRAAASAGEEHERSTGTKRDVRQERQSG